MISPISAAASTNVAGMLTQKQVPAARRRRREFSDTSTAKIRRQLSYKCGWYGSRLTEAERLFLSSRLCPVWDQMNEPGWKRNWTCEACYSRHDRNSNAAIDLALYSEGEAGIVRAPTAVESSVRLAAASRCL